MASDPTLDRRTFLTATAASAAAVTVPSWLTGCATTGAAVASADPQCAPPDYFESGFGVTPEVIRKVMTAALSRGGDFADLYFQHSQSLALGLEDDAVNRAYTSVDLGVGVRVVVGDQTGFAFTEELTPASMVAAAKTAAGIASSAARVAPAPTATALPAHYGAYAWPEAGIPQLIPMLDGLNDAAHAADPTVQRVQVSFAAGQNVIMVVDSDGRSATDSQPMTRLALSVLMEKGGQRQSNHYNVAARAGLDFYTAERRQRVVDQAIERTRVLFEAKRPPAGELPVVLAAGSSGILLHEAIGHGMEADFNRKGISIYSDKIGKPVAQPFVSIVDDGTNPDLRGSINVDDEGNASERTYLVENGVLQSYMHDRISARHYDVEPTGSGRRQSFRHAPMPRMRNTYMLPGPHERQEIIRSVAKGIYAVSFTNGQVHIGAGDYAFYVKNGWLIENGKLTAPVKDINLIGNGPESLERVTMVGNDVAMDEGGWTCGKDGQSVPVSLGLPTILVSKIVVGGSNA